MKHYFLFFPLFFFCFFLFSCGGIKETNKKNPTTDKFSITVSPETINDTAHFYDENKSVCVPLSISITKNSKPAKDYVQLYYLNPLFVTVYDENNSYISSFSNLTIDKTRVLKLCYYLSFKEESYQTSVVVKYQDAISSIPISVSKEEVNFRLIANPDKIVSYIDNSKINYYILLSFYANSTPVANSKINAYSLSDSVAMNNSFTTDANGIALVPVTIDTSKKINSFIVFSSNNYNVQTIVPVIIDEISQTQSINISPSSVDLYFDIDSNIKYKDVNFLVSITDSNSSKIPVHFSFSNSSLGACFDELGNLANFFTYEIDKYYNLTCRIFAPETPITTTAFVIANSSTATVNIKSERVPVSDISVFFVPDSFTYYTKQDEDSYYSYTFSILAYTKDNKPLPNEDIIIFYPSDDDFLLYPYSSNNSSNPLHLTTDSSGTAFFNISFLAKNNYYYTKLITAVCRNKTATLKFEVK